MNNKWQHIKTQLSLDKTEIEKKLQKYKEKFKKDMLNKEKYYTEKIQNIEDTNEKLLDNQNKMSNEK